MAKKTEAPDRGAAEFRAFVADFAAESDRAAVILAAAKLDLQLSQILRKFLQPCANATDDLLDGDSPLATFSSRIKMCYRLGLIDKQIAQSLNLIRRIRNSFAHEFTGISLNSGAHRDRIRELVSPVIENDHFKQVLGPFFDNLKTPSSEFRAFCALLSRRLEGIYDAVQTIEDLGNWTVIPPAWKRPYKPEEVSDEAAEINEGGTAAA